MNRICRILLISVVTFSSNLAYTQSVVILNGVPTRVQLDGDKIVSILEEVPNYLSSEYERKNTEIKHGDPANVVKDAKTSQPAEAIAVNATTKAKSTETTETVETKTTISSEPLVSKKFKFSGNSALLSELSISEIKNYAKKVISGEASSVTLESFFQTGNRRSEQLINNRLDACKKYFELSGVDSSKIMTNKIADNNQSNEVSVTLK